MIINQIQFFGITERHFTKHCELNLTCRIATRQRKGTPEILKVPLRCWGLLRSFLAKLNEHRCFPFWVRRRMLEGIHIIPFWNPYRDPSGPCCSAFGIPTVIPIISLFGIPRDPYYFLKGIPRVPIISLLESLWSLFFPLRDP